MKRAIGWMVDNPVSVNLLLAFIIGYGLVQIILIKKEVFPEYSLDVISISVPYRGATPQDVEEAVCTRIEEEISGLDGIKKISSTASEGLGSIIVEIQKGYDSRKLTDDIQSAVDRITNFPKDIEKPVISEISLKRQVLKVVVYGDASEKDLKRMGERMRDDLSAMPGISLVTLASVRPYEISVNVTQKSLEKYRLTIPGIARIIAANCRDFPAGRVRQKGEEILVRTKGLKYNRHDFMYIPVIVNDDGAPVYLKDIASIDDGFEETDASSAFDGKRSLIIRVFRIGQQSALGVEKAVKDYLAGVSSRLPTGIHTAVIDNTTRVLRSRMNLLMRNGTYGLVLVIVLLALFLELRLSLWVAMGIPASFFGAFILLPQFDVSINMISLFAFIICLGIVVDDAIIVGEHIFQKIESGMERRQAAIEGAYEMAVPVIFTVLTTIAAFVPLLMVSGIFGKFMTAIPSVVISVLTISLIEALFILPSHLAHLKERRQSRVLRVLPGFFNRQLNRFMDAVYLPILKKAINWKYVTISIGVFMLLVTIGFVKSGRIDIVFFPKVEADQVVASVKMPQGASAEQTGRVVNYLAGRAEALREKINREYGKNVILHIVSNVASMPYASRHGEPLQTGPNVGEVALELVKSEFREGIGSERIADRWREITGVVPGAESIKFSSSLFSAGEPIDVELSSDTFDDLSAAAARLKEELKKYKGVKDISDNIQGGKQEIKLVLTPRGRALGLDVETLGLQVRGAFYGSEAVRIQREKDDVRVMVRYPLSERSSLYNLEQMKIATPAGDFIPLSQVASWKIRPGYSVIKRADRRRVVDVTANVNEAAADAKKILTDLKGAFLPALAADYPGLAYSFQGEEKERRDSMESMMEGFFVALFFIFVLLAIPFNSYVQPLIIMTAIPFGIIGAILGHLILGYNLSLLSFFGIVALSGVLVNDSLVLLVAINKKMAQHPEDSVTAVLQAARSRFRPVMLTSLTTFGGLMPMIFEKSMQARFLIPMAISLGFGIMFATVITLLLIPAIYMVTVRKA
ncbi:MAG: efflux RND transporter permease subunit [Deltaproteobacteria bacterium]|nr:efflux RND transporter permease subunit [Deltaproteobacteria bacterium]